MIHHLGPETLPAWERAEKDREQLDAKASAVAAAFKPEPIEFFIWKGKTPEEQESLDDLNATAVILTMEDAGNFQARHYSTTSGLCKRCGTETPYSTQHVCFNCCQKNVADALMYLKGRRDDAGGSQATE